MNKLTTKNAVKASINKSTKQIRFTQQYFRNVTEGEATLGTSKSFIILNKNRLDKMIADGYKVVDAKSTQNITKSSTTVEIVDLTGVPEVEEAIRRNYVKHKPVSFVKNAREFSQQGMKTALEIFGETKFEKVQPLTFHSAYDKFEKTQIGRERKAQMMEVAQ